MLIASLEPCYGDGLGLVVDDRDRALSALALEQTQKDRTGRQNFEGRVDETSEKKKHRCLRQVIEIYGHLPSEITLNAMGIPLYGNLSFLPRGNQRRRPGGHSE